MCVLVVWPGIVPDNHPLAGQVRLDQMPGYDGSSNSGPVWADRPGAFQRSVPILEDRPAPKDQSRYSRGIYIIFYIFIYLNFPRNNLILNNIKN